MYQSNARGAGDLLEMLDMNDHNFCKPDDSISRRPRNGLHLGDRQVERLRLDCSAWLSILSACAPKRVMALIDS